jgi:hypothetical protein
MSSFLAISAAGRHPRPRLQLPNTAFDLEACLASERVDPPVTYPWPFPVSMSTAVVQRVAAFLPVDADHRLTRELARAAVSAGRTIPLIAVTVGLFSLLIADGIAVLTARDNPSTLVAVLGAIVAIGSAFFGIKVGADAGRRRPRRPRSRSRRVD